MILFISLPFNLNNNEKGKYSEKFKQLYKKKNYKSKKLEFRKK